MTTQKINVKTLPQSKKMTLKVNKNKKFSCIIRVLPFITNFILLTIQTQKDPFAFSPRID